MKAGKYNIKELFSNKNIESVIIPEIQRDYVWGTDQVNGLLQSIFDDFLNFLETKAQINITINDDKSLEKTLSEYYKTIKYNTSIGFIYAYSDFEYPDKYFLIDGQQRLTTIYLLLVAIASEDEQFRSQFSKLYFKNGKSFIEYRVREASLLFLNQSITHTIEEKKTSLEEQYWYYNFYKNDKTIQSIINNLKTIKDFLSENISDINSFKDYVLNHVQFWYFDTNISEQGEELYIYMNARGERMQSNENLKAELLAKISYLEKKNEWGSKWEEWQNYFWIIRGKHENADNVFNEFVYCVAGLENQKNNVGIIIKNIDKVFLTPTNNQILRCFNDIAVIKKHIDSLKTILGSEILEFCKSNNISHNWIIKTRNEIRRLLNNNQTNYFIKIDDTNRGTEQNRMVLLWSILELFLDIKIVDLNLIISLRIIYNRYYNYNRAVLTNLNDIEKFKNKGFESVVRENNNDEESLKYKFLSARKDKGYFNKMLSLIWEIEDHPINLDGSFAQNINSAHLLNYSKNISIEELRQVKDKFYELFPVKQDKNVDWTNYSKVLRCLISYGKCWNEKVTNGYDNLDFDSKKRILRDLDSEDERCFSRFFNDYLVADNLSQLESEIVVEPRYNEQTEDWLEAIQWYNYHLKEKMWSEGFFIAVGGWNFRKKDRYFPNRFQLVNTKGNFQGGNPIVLSKKVKVKKN
ncbi:DUF262 domain-containing protein [Chryseobacterium foetidum]|uniref:DUF262 domain-containing protein n=1 Tax=Chryseobacterium foetidum TaxID=2951057 RepID=UPI0021C9E738|nr:DUF262 domain-containing protein [Chryseobacterium foetidum]